jgi:hypothetical protein
MVYVCLQETGQQSSSRRRERSKGSSKRGVKSCQVEEKAGAAVRHAKKLIEQQLAPGHYLIR